MWELSQEILKVKYLHIRVTILPNTVYVLRALLMIKSADAIELRTEEITLG